MLCWTKAKKQHKNYWVCLEIHHICLLEIHLVLPDLGKRYMVEQKAQGHNSPRIFQVWHTTGQKITDLCLASSHTSATLRGRGPSGGSLHPWKTASLRFCQTAHLCTSLSNLEQHRVFHIRPKLLKVIFFFFASRPICLPVNCLRLYLAPVRLINTHSLWHRPCSLSLFQT